MQHRIILSALLALGIALPATSASATDRKAYHASFCLSSIGSDADYGRSEYRITKSSGSGTGTLLCPITHDAFECDSTFGGCVSRLTAEVRVLDNHNAGDIACTMSTRDESGSSFFYSTATTTARPATLETLYLTGGMSFDDDYTYILKCTVPTNDTNGYTKIYGYTVEEL